MKKKTSKIYKFNIKNYFYDNWWLFCIKKELFVNVIQKHLKSKNKKRNYMDVFNNIFV